MTVTCRNYHLWPDQPVLYSSFAATTRQQGATRSKEQNNDKNGPICGNRDIGGLSVLYSGEDYPPPSRNGSKSSAVALIASKSGVSGNDGGGGGAPTNLGSVDRNSNINRGDGAASNPGPVGRNNGSRDGSKTASKIPDKGQMKARQCACNGSSDDKPLQTQPPPLVISRSSKEESTNNAANNTSRPSFLKKEYKVKHPEKRAAKDNVTPNSSDEANKTNLMVGSATRWSEGNEVKNKQGDAIHPASVQEQSNKDGEDIQNIASASPKKKKNKKKKKVSSFLDYLS